MKLYMLFEIDRSENNYDELEHFPVLLNFFFTLEEAKKDLYEPLVDFEDVFENVEPKISSEAPDSVNDYYFNYTNSNPVFYEYKSKTKYVNDFFILEIDLKEKK